MEQPKSLQISSNAQLQMKSMRDQLCKHKDQAYHCMHELAEIKADELDLSSSQCENMEYMLEKIMRCGTYEDSVHAIRHFIDYVYAKNRLDYI